MVSIKIEDCTFCCWSCEGRTLRLPGAELVVRKLEKGHIDYVCPDCEKVIICRRY